MVRCTYIAVVCSTRERSGNGRSARAGMKGSLETADQEGQEARVMKQIAGVVEQSKEPQHKNASGNAQWVEIVNT